MDDYNASSLLEKVIQVYAQLIVTIIIITCTQ